MTTIKNKTQIAKNTRIPLKWKNENWIKKDKLKIRKVMKKNDLVDNKNQCFSGLCSNKYLATNSIGSSGFSLARWASASNNNGISC